MIPWKQNCPHIDNGWCIKCVSRLGDAIDAYRNIDGSRGVLDMTVLDDVVSRLERAMYCVEQKEEEANP